MSNPDVSAYWKQSGETAVLINFYLTPGEQSMYHLVYLTTNLVNGKFYVGVHSTWKEEDGYLGSGISIKNAIKKYGKENFKRVILHYCLDNEQAFAIEKQIVNKSFLENNNTYNMALGGPGFRIGIINKSVSSIEKMKNTIRNRSKETQQIIIENNRIAASKRNKDTLYKIPPMPGKLNPRARNFLLIDPSGKEYNVYGNSVQFFSEHKLSRALFIKFIDKGKITYEQYYYMTLQTKNSIGWEIKEVKKNSILLI